MVTTTAEKSNSETKRRKAQGAQDEPVAETSHTDLLARLADKGFDVPLPIIVQWDPETRGHIDSLVSGRPLMEHLRDQCDGILSGFKTAEPDPKGEAAGNAKPSADVDASKCAENPLPAQKGSPPDVTNATNAAELNAKRTEGNRRSFAEQQATALAGAQYDIEEALLHQEELKGTIEGLRSDLKEAKASYDAAVTRGQKAYATLIRARSGLFERTLPFPSNKSAGLDVPDQDIGSTKAVGSAPPQQADEGAFVMLANLVKGTLQEYIEGTDSEKGISAKQCEALVKVVGGETIGALEKWQRENGGGEWWRKALKDKGVGLGGKACDNLVEAHETIRRKFPIPEPVSAVAAESPAAETPTAIADPTDIVEARETLARIIEMCKEVEKGTANLEGVRLAQDIGKKAKSVLETLAGQEEPTEAQVSAIRGWHTGIYAWHDRLDSEDEFGDGVDGDDEDENEDDLDVPDADEDGEDE